MHAASSVNGRFATQGCTHYRLRALYATAAWNWYATSESITTSDAVGRLNSCADEAANGMKEPG